MKTLRMSVWKRFGLLLLAAVCWLGAARAEAWSDRGTPVDAALPAFADVLADWDGMTLEKTAVRLAQQAGATWRETRRVWASVDYSGLRLLLEQDGADAAYLIGADGSLRRVPAAELPAAYAPENVIFFNPPDADGVMVYKLDADYYSDKANQSGEFAALPQNTMHFNVASHEAFHNCQGAWAPGAGDQEALYVEAERNPGARLLRVQLIESLRQAILQPDDAAAHLSAARWWYDRYCAEYPRECELATLSDRLEGTARYFDMALCVRSALGMDADAPALHAAYQALVREDYALDAARYDGYADSESYDLGGAACILLELQGASGWQERIEAGETPVAVLLEGVPPVPQAEDPSLAALVQAALQAR